MIKSFKHKGLEKFYKTESKAGIQPSHAKKLGIILPLKGELEGYWSVKVNGNWRVTFRFDGNDTEIVDYQDYH